MLRLRLLALALALLSVSVALGGGMSDLSRAAEIAVLVAAGCLALVSPFDAPDLARRRLVFIACLAYITGILVAAALAFVGEAGKSILAMLLLLAFFGCGLAVWAFSTRKRRRISGYQHYYDH